MDNIEITEEMLDDAIKCDSCKTCTMPDRGGMSLCLTRVASALKSLREERKNNPGVWDNAPDYITRVNVENISYAGTYSSGQTYTRESPKSKARQIAEKAAKSLVHINCGIGVSVPDAIEAAILEYAKETK